MKKPTGRGRIVADKRNFDQPQKNTQKQPAKPTRRRAARPPRRGNVLSRGIAGIVSLVWRVVWGSFWRLGLTMVAFLAAA
ncbi:hypothetical protein RNH99_30095, partial [Pseudomonas paraeruginosa]|uniref:hypothetical protein n=1 Tax=Pseudomonas paraeruginosa TaxID=2994495 RepID=UPI0028865577